MSYSAISDIEASAGKIEGVGDSITLIDARDAGESS